MDDQEQAQNVEVEQTTVDTSPVSETESQEAPTVESQEAVEQAAEAISETRHTPRAERRIRELARKNRELEQQQQPQFPQIPFTPPRMPQYEPGAEVSPEQLQRDVAQAADGIAQLRVQQAIAQYDQTLRQQQRAQQFEADVAQVD